MDTTQAVQAGTTAGTIIALIIGIAIYVLLIIAQWKMFTKAGEAGWKSIIPLYNLFIFCKIVDGNGWKFLLLCIPGVNIVYDIILSIRTAKAFGEGTGFAVGLIFLPTIFWLILGFGSAQYVGPRGEGAAPEAPVAPEAPAAPAAPAAPEAPQATEDAPVEE